MECTGCLDELEASTTSYPPPLSERRLNRLALILTEICNIACPYCYEHRDPDTFYNPERSKRNMSEEGAIDILQRAYQLWPRIGTLFFFGGEPLLKKKVIKHICEVVINNEIIGMRKAPRFGLVTNATLLDEEAIQLIEQFDISINVSLDGPPEVNDLTRITKRRAGTSEVTLQNLLKLRSRGINYEIEATFSKFHLMAGISVMDLMDYFYDVHDIRVLHAPWVSADKNDSYYLTDDEIFNAYEPAIKYSMENLRKGIPKVIFFVDKWLRILQSYDPAAMRPYCPACFSEISVNAAGDIYPCFMFNGLQELKIGNVYNDKFFQEVNQAVIEAFYHTIFGPCDCPPEYQQFHSGCVGSDRIATNSIVSKPYCNIYSKLLEVFLAEVRKGVGQPFRQKLPVII